MDTERYKALMDAADIVVNAMCVAEGREPVLILGHALDCIFAELDREMEAEEVSA